MSKDYTIECWIKREEGTTIPTVADVKGNGHPDSPNIAISKEMMGTLEVNKWHHVSAVRQQDKVKTYIDGELMKNVAKVTRKADGKFQLKDNHTEVVFPDRASLVIHIAKMRILHPEIEITGDIDE